MSQYESLVLWTPTISNMCPVIRRIRETAHGSVSSFWQVCWNQVTYAERKQHELRDLTRYRNKLMTSAFARKTVSWYFGRLQHQTIQHHESFGQRSGNLVNRTHLIKKNIKRNDITCMYHKVQWNYKLLYQAWSFMNDDMLYIANHSERILNGPKLWSDLTPRISVPLCGCAKTLSGLSRKTVEDLIAEIGVDIGSLSLRKKHLT